MTMTRDEMADKIADLAADNLQKAKTVAEERLLSRDEAHGILLLTQAYATVSVAKAGGHR